MQHPRLCFALAILVCVIVTIDGCFITGEKGAQPQVHVIQWGRPPDHGEEDTPQIIEVHIPDSRKKRELSDNDNKICIVDTDCPDGQKCNSKSSICLSDDPKITEELPEDQSEPKVPHHAFISISIQRMYSDSEHPPPPTLPQIN